MTAKQIGEAVIAGQHLLLVEFRGYEIKVRGMRDKLTGKEYGQLVAQTKVDRLDTAERVDIEEWLDAPAGREAYTEADIPALTKACRFKKGDKLIWVVEQYAKVKGYWRASGALSSLETAA